jgi:hypothetical protein
MRATRCRSIQVETANNANVLGILLDTDPFRRGVELYVGRTGSNLCAVSAMLDHLNKRGKSPGLLFHSEDGRALSGQLFVEAVRDGLRKAGVDQEKYCGQHSFCRLQPWQQKGLRIH